MVFVHFPGLPKIIYLYGFVCRGIHNGGGRFAGGGRLLVVAGLQPGLNRLSGRYVRVCLPRAR